VKLEKIGFFETSDGSRSMRRLLAPFCLADFLFNCSYAVIYQIPLTLLKACIISAPGLVLILLLGLTTVEEMSKIILRFRNKIKDNV
jgi:hypothetical protein